MTQTQSLHAELPEARIVEVIEAVGHALKGEGGVTVDKIDTDDDTLRTALDEAVREALDISPLKALAKVWKSTAEVKKLIGPKGPQDGKTRKVAMAAHKLEASHVPEIHVELAKLATLKKVPVPVTFSIAISGLVLSVKDRFVTGIASGSAQPEVSVKVEDVTLFKEKLRKINLPVDITLYEAKDDAEPAKDPTSTSRADHVSSASSSSP